MKSLYTVLAVMCDDEAQVNATSVYIDDVESENSPAAIAKLAANTAKYWLCDADADEDEERRRMVDFLGGDTSNMGVLVTIHEVDEDGFPLACVYQDDEWHTRGEFE